MIASQSVIAERHVTEGDSVIFSGLFIQFTGQIRMELIVRTGTLAMLPDEPILTTLNKPGKAYLAGAHAFGGNSGSPMFINLGGIRGGAMMGADYKLLGVVAGEFFETQDLELKTVSSYQTTLKANSGISMIVPVDEIATLLNSKYFQSVRDAFMSKP